MDPATLAIIGAVAAGANLGSQAIGSVKAKKLRKKAAKEAKRQTEEDLLNAHLNRAYQNEEQGIRSSHRLSQRRSEALKNTAANVRGALL